VRNEASRGLARRETGEAGIFRTQMRCRNLVARARRSLGVILVTLAAACGPADPFGGRASAQAAYTPASPHELPAAIPGGYKVTPLPVSGTVIGSVAFDGVAPPDSIVHPAVDADVCGRTLADPTVQHRGPHLAGAVVWLTGITAGKPLPLTRRYDLVTETCRLLPRVQTAIVGGMLNVRSVDQVTHATRFVRGTDTLVVIPETEEGQVVPTPKPLTAAGLVEVSCDRHPWSRGWIAVFDQPYFTMTDADGGFAIDSVPPGRYAIWVWHERFGLARDSVTVVGGHGSAPVALRFRGSAPERPATP